MNTLVLKKETERFGSKPFLLTLKKSFGNYPTIVDIAPIGQNRKVQIVDGKLIKMNRQESNISFLEGVKMSDKTLLGIEVEKSSLMEKPLVSKTKIGSKFGVISAGTNVCLNQNLTETVAEDKNSGSTMNKHDRFIPNILRATRIAENNFNDSSSIAFHRTQTMTSLERDLCRNDYQNLKRNRKQILDPLKVKRDSMQRTRIPRKKTKLNRSFLRKRICNSVNESDTEAPEFKTSNVTQKNNGQSFETNAKESVEVEKTPTHSEDSNNIYSANLEVFDQAHDLLGAKETDVPHDYKSIRQIFAEFEIADYENYIASEDRSFNVDEMDKLVSSDINGSSLIESSIFYHGTEKLEHDENGNDIDNYGNVMTRQTDENQLRPCNTQCMIKPYYDDEIEPTINTSTSLKCDTTFDDIFSAAWDDASSYNASEFNVWSTDFEDSICSDDCRDFHHCDDRSSSSTDTALESETDVLNTSQHFSSFALPTTKNLGTCVTSLAVADVVPDHIFNNNYNEACSDSLKCDNTRKSRFCSSPIMQPYNKNENISCDTPPGEPLEKSNSRLKLFNDFDAAFELLTDDNFLVDSKLNINYAVLNENETCESILANSNAKFEDSESPNISNDVPDTMNESSQSNELKNSDSGRLIADSSQLVVITKEDVDEVIISKLESLLTKSQPHYGDYLRACDPSAISCNTDTDSKIADDERHTEIDITDSLVSFDNSGSRHVTNSASSYDVSYSSPAQEIKITDQNTVPNFDDEYRDAEIRFAEISELESLHCENSYNSSNCSSISCPVSPKILLSSAKLPVDRRKPEQDVCEGFIDRSEQEAHNKSNSACKFCNKQFSCETDLADHIKTNHPYRRVNLGRKKNKVYVCHKCSKEYCLAKSITRHFKMHDDYILTCRICEKHFTEKAYLQRHMNIDHPHKKIECTFCSKKYSTKATLIGHLNKYHGVSNSWLKSII